MKTTLCEKWFSPTRSAILRALSLSLTSLIVAGCPAGKTKTENIIIRGSNTIGEELAPRLIAEFRKDHPALGFDLEFKGTTYGLGALMVERCDIAAASRPTSTNEMKLAQDRDVKLIDHIIGFYSVAVIVNAANAVTNLTQDQVRDIFTGTVTNWNAVGGPNARIQLFIRDPISGTYLGFQELAMEKKPYALDLKTSTNYTGIVEAVALEANGIGYVSFDLTRKPGVKAVSIGGVEPSVPTVNKGQYPYARLLRLYTNKPRETKSAREFVQFVESPRGQEILSQMGYMPRP